MASRLQFSKSSYTIAAGVMVWQILLIILFPYSFSSTLIILLLGLVFSSLSFGLVHYFNNKKHRLAGWGLVLLSSFYLQLITLPADKYDAQPVNEVRAAVSILVSTQPISPDFLLDKHEPPFAPITAALHKYDAELPEYSWIIRLECSEGQAPSYLFNIRNNIAGSNHPAMIRAELVEDYFLLEIIKHDIPVRYQIPLDKKFTPFTVSGRTGNTIAQQHTYEATVFPHMLSVSGHSVFQSLFYHILRQLHS